VWPEDAVVDESAFGVAQCQRGMPHRPSDLDSGGGVSGDDVADKAAQKGVTAAATVPQPSKGCVAAAAAPLPAIEALAAPITHSGMPLIVWPSALEAHLSPTDSVTTVSSACVRRVGNTNHGRRLEYRDQDERSP
jgi:hypothetical protein